MLITAIVGLSLILQIITIWYALRLITLTGKKKAWIFLSIGISTMGIRRFITFINLLKGDAPFHSELLYEIAGLAGSAIMLAGVVLIKPVFVSISESEQEQRKLADHLQEALSHIKTLSGMLPICASCKKIRNDKGYWESIEQYIRAHSDAEFSHGICPECVQKLYPELYDKIGKTKENGQG